LKLTIQQIKDYIKCPSFYNFKHIEKINESPLLSSALSEKMHTVIYHFFFKVMDGKVPELEYLRSKWEHLWFGKKINPIKYVTTPRNETWEIGMKSVVLLDNFYNSTYLNPGFPLVVNQGFSVQIGDHLVTGKFEVVREIMDGPRRIIEILAYNTSSQAPIQWLVDNDIYISVLSYAFREKFQSKEQRETVYHLKTNKTFFTYRTEDQLKKLASIVNNVAEGIKKQIFYPRHLYMCNSCSYKDTCN